MRNRWAIAAATGIAGLAVAATATWSPRASGADADEAAIRKRAPEFAAAWNAHDAKALAAFWTDDGDFVGPWGRKATGRAEVEALFAEEHGAAGPYRASTLEVKADAVRLATPDVAVEDLEVLVTGALSLDGSKAPPTTLVVPMVVRRVGAVWKTFAARPHVRLAPAIAAAVGGVPAPAGGAPAARRSEPLTPEVVKQVTDALHAPKATVRASSQPLIGLVQSVAEQAKVRALFSIEAERIATDMKVEMTVEDMDAAAVLDLLAGVGGLKWSVAGAGVVFFEPR